MVSTIEEKDSQKHKLNDSWTLWTHLPNDTNWNLSSYKKITTLESVESTLTFFNNCPDSITKNCMIFLMREGINPCWEDVRNYNGGCFSYKISNKNIVNCWKNLSFLLVGETLSTPEISKHINGITISPKKNFYIVKIWLDTCDYCDPNIIVDIKDIEDLQKSGCLFKKHISD